MFNRRFSSARRRRLSRVNVGMQQKRSKTIATTSTRRASIAKSLENLKNDKPPITVASENNNESVKRHCSLIPNIKFGSISDIEADEDTQINLNKSNEFLLGHNLHSRQSLSQDGKRILSIQSSRNSLTPEDNLRMMDSRKNSNSSPLPLPELSLSPRNSINSTLSQHYVGYKSTNSIRNLSRNNIGSVSIPINELKPSASCRTSPRGSIELYKDKSVSRNSLGTLETNRNFRNMLPVRPEVGYIHRTSVSLKSHDDNKEIPRRFSADNQDNQKRKSNSSPHRSASIRVNYKFNNSSWNEINKTMPTIDSRRKSSNASFYEVMKRMSNDTDTISRNVSSIGGAINLTTYDSIAYQLKDAHIESNSTCEFVIRALKIFNRTLIVSILLVFLSSLPLVMLIMGSHFFRDCPIEPNIPLYMVIAGGVGCVKMIWMIWSKFFGDQYCIHPEDEPSTASISMLNNFLSVSMTIFLIVWFILANHWIWRIYWPDFQPTLFEPNQWCHQTLYVFSLVHLSIIYSIISIVIILIILFSCCHIFDSLWLRSINFKR